jgi:hypothetical protein
MVASLVIPHKARLPPISLEVMAQMCRQTIGAQRLLPRPDSGAFLHPMLMTKLFAMFAPVLFWHLAHEGQRRSSVLYPLHPPLLPGLVSVKGCTDFAHVCAVNADSLVKLFTGDAEGPRPVSDVRGHLGVDLVRVEGTSLFWMLEGYGACNDV